MDDSDDTLKLHRDLIIACGWGKEVDVILLLQQGASVRVQDQDGKNCLHYAACKGHIQVTNLLIENGCNINARDKSDRTPLHLAAEEGHHDILSILLDNNAEFDVQDEDGNAPCHVACMNDYFEVVELLIHVKADLNIKNKDGLTPLHIATLNHHLKSMNLLMKAGVNKSIQDNNGNTALHIAAQENALKAFKALIKNGADVNIQNHDGNTALHLCADSGNVQFADYILNVDQPVQLSSNNVGDTAKDIAIRHGYKEIVQMIPDPSRKKKTVKDRHKCCTSESRSNSPATNPSPAHSQHSDDVSTKTPNANITTANSSPTANTLHPTTYVDPSEEPTSSSQLSLFVPTTDSGISLPMDVRGDQTPVTSLQRRKSHKQKAEKPKLFDELQQYDSHRMNKDGRNRPRTSSKKDSEVYTHEYKELRYDPRFMSPQTNPKNRGKSSNKHNGNSDRRYSDHFIDSGALSDESIQPKGCFFKTKSKKISRNASRNPKQLSAEAEKEIMMQRQAELQYQLNASKLSLEKQMRKMRKKFERALQATDERFIEQKKREESFHYQLRNELEVIERSLERGSKKNVEEFTQHIKAELNNLAERLMKGADINASDSQSDDAPARRLHKRESAVDLDKDISVSLQRNESPTKSSKKKRHTNSSSASSSSTKTEEDQSLIKVYEERVKALEREAKIKETKEQENKELRARILELERIVMSNNSKTAVT